MRCLSTEDSVSDVILVFLQLTLNMFSRFIYRLQRWISTCTCLKEIAENELHHLCFLVIVPAIREKLEKQHFKGIFLLVPSRYLLVQTQQLILQNKVWNLFKINNKDTRTTLMTSFWCRACQLWMYFTHCSGISIVNIKWVNAGSC